MFKETLKERLIAVKGEEFVGDDMMAPLGFFKAGDETTRLVQARILRCQGKTIDQIVDIIGVSDHFCFYTYDEETELLRAAF